MKWMPPECMVSTKKANEKSDVWSYAVVLWEIFTLGKIMFIWKIFALVQDTFIKILALGKDILI